jgi:hypothetical protein
VVRVEAIASSLTSVLTHLLYCSLLCDRPPSFHFQAHSILVAGREAECAAGQSIQRFGYRFAVETKPARLITLEQQRPGVATFMAVLPWQGVISNSQFHFW